MSHDFDPICPVCELTEYETGTHCDCGSCQVCCQCGTGCDCTACLDRLSGYVGPKIDELSISETFLVMPGLRRLALAMALTGLVMHGAPSQAKDFGVIGQVYPVIEEDFLAMITAGFRAMEDDGRMARIREEAVVQVKQSVLRPRGAILPRAETPRVFTVDLSVTLERDLADQEGRVFARAGTVVNPLAYSRFNKRIVMIDGDDPEQVAFALSEGNELDTLIVLVRGSWHDLMSAHGRRFWFDMDQQMARKFGVKSLPSVITRADPLMRIEEVPVGKAQRSAVGAGSAQAGGKGQ